MIDEIKIHQEKLKGFYDENGQLKCYPTKKHQRILALIKLVGYFDKAKKYNEKEVNALIRKGIAFSDVETIRREMYQYHLLDRLRDGSTYWVEDKWQEKYQDYLD